MAMDYFIDTKNNDIVISTSNFDNLKQIDFYKDRIDIISHEGLVDFSADITDRNRMEFNKMVLSYIRNGCYKNICQFEGHFLDLYRNKRENDTGSIVAVISPTSEKDCVFNLILLYISNITGYAGWICNDPVPIELYDALYKMICCA